MTSARHQPDHQHAEGDTSADGDAELRAYLAACDAACPECGYGLRGVRSRVCPECGSPIVLGRLLAAAQHLEWRRRRLPLTRAVTAGLVGSILGLPFAILTAGAVFFFAELSAAAARFPLRTAAAAGLAGQVVLIWLYLERTERIARLPRGRQAALAWAAWVWPWVVLGVVLGAVVLGLRAGV